MRIKINEKISRSDRDTLSDKFINAYFECHKIDDWSLEELIPAYFDEFFSWDLNYNRFSQMDEDQIKDYVKKLTFNTMSEEEYDEYGYKSYNLEARVRDVPMVLVSR